MWGSFSTRCRSMGPKLEARQRRPLISCTNFTRATWVSHGVVEAVAAQRLPSLGEHAVSRRSRCGRDGTARCAIVEDEVGLGGLVMAIAFVEGSRGIAIGA